MKRNLTLLTLLLLALNAPAQNAQNFTPPGGPVETLTYEQARQMFRIRQQTSPAEARLNAAALAGTVLEMQGDVVGMMATQKGRVFMMRVEGALVTFGVAQKFSNFAALQSGNKARVLAELGDDAGFTIVAATTSLLDTAIVPEPDPAILPVTPEPKSDVIVVPPMSVMTAPSHSSSPASRTPASRTPAPMPKIFRPGTVENTVKTIAPSPPPAPAKSNPTATLDLIVQQKPAYMNIVRRYNNKLSESVIEEVATALLTYGYKHRLDPRFLASVVAVESRFNPTAMSPSGAMGLGQLMPFKASELKVNPFSPSQNIDGMARTLRMHLDTFSKFGERGPLLAVAAYNAGPNAVKRAGNNVPSGEQVQKYVWKVYFAYKSLAPDMFK